MGPCLSPIKYGTTHGNYLKGRLNTDNSPQNFWTTFLANDLTEQLKKSAVANAIAMPLPLCFSYFVMLRRFQEILTKPFYFYVSRTCSSSRGTPSVVSLALRSLFFAILTMSIHRGIIRGHIIFPNCHFIESSFCRTVMWSNSHFRIVKLPKLYNVECHFIESSFSRMSFSRIVI